MKVWVGYGSEHSANMVIIGTFESVKKAEEMQTIVEEAMDIALHEDEATTGEAAQKFSPEMLNLLVKHNIAFGYGDPEELRYEYNLKREGNKLVVTTEDMAFNAVLKLLISGSAKVQVYSAHDHGGPYGRRTH